MRECKQLLLWTWQDGEQKKVVHSFLNTAPFVERTDCASEGQGAREERVHVGREQ